MRPPTLPRSKPPRPLWMKFFPTYGGVATSLADLGYAALGEIASVITTGTAAQKQSLSDAGLDNSVITAIEAAVKGFGSIGGFIASLVSKK